MTAGPMKAGPVKSGPVKSGLRVAIVHDWLLGMRGGERVLEELVLLYPDCEIFTLFYKPEAISPIISSRPVHACGGSKWPQIARYYRHLLPIYSHWVEELSQKIERLHAEAPFDLVISVSHCVAKNIKTPPGVPHICYCLTPMRYIWDQYDAYFRGRWIEPLVRLFVSKLRRDDVRALESINCLAVISQFVQRRVHDVWRSESTVIYPAVRTDWIKPCGEGEPGEGFLCVCALVPYKRVDVVVEAFNQLGLPLTIIGRGPDEARLKARAKANIRFIASVSDAELAEYYRHTRALVFAAEEDFGMSPVEAQAAGRPVIAYARGGCRETVLSEGARKTGILVSEQTAEHFASAVYRFLDREMEFTVENCTSQARRFSVERFHEEFSRLVSQVTEQNLREAQC